MTGAFWFTTGFCTLAIGVCWYFDRLSKAQRKRDAMIDREEARMREDARAMRDWYNSTRINVEGETEAEIAAVFLDMAARG